MSSVSVSSGIFTVSRLAPAFYRREPLLEISARLNGSGRFTLLTPRQLITSTCAVRAW